MKIAVSGKGGVGKTTLVALLSKALVDNGRDVIAIDADPDANLAAALGFQESERIVPLVEMEELIAERTGSDKGSYGQFFKLNPHVADIPETFSYEQDGIRFMVLGTIQKGGSGCACPENTFLRTLLNHLVLLRDEAILVDLEAGVEHLGRATVQGIDALIVVVEPGLRSVQTAHQVVKLANDIGLKKICVVGNKIRSDQDEELLKAKLGELPVLGFMRYDEALVTADLEGRSPCDDPELVEAARQILAELQDRFMS